MFLFTREVWNTRAALFSACFIAIVPGKGRRRRRQGEREREIGRDIHVHVHYFFSGYISRSVAGSYDNEGIAIFALMLTYFFWMRAVKTGSVFWAAGTALSYFYMVSIMYLFLNFASLPPLPIGISLGWLCIHYKPHSSSCLYSNDNWTFL